MRSMFFCFPRVFFEVAVEASVTSSTVFSTANFAPQVPAGLSDKACEQRLGTNNKPRWNSSGRVSGRQAC
jgi:hypothetical protein